MLHADELAAAIRHELVHVRRRDNLKKLLLRAFAFPFFGMLERAWIEAAEINADDEATKDEREALDLASALLKISRLNARVSCRELAMDLVSARDPVEARVERLLAWKSRAPAARSWRLPVMLAILSVVMFASMWELAPVHAITELLIRR